MAKVAKNGQSDGAAQSAPATVDAQIEADAQPATEKGFAASIYPGPARAVPSDLADAVHALEEALGMPTWLLIQAGSAPEHLLTLNEPVRRGFFDARDELRACKKVALVVDSPGGSATATYQLATLLRRHCEEFVAVVPRYAKSAATLLSLGASELYMGSDGQLGPLDAQLLDPEREEIASALDEVQALERLHSAALDQADQSMQLLLARTGKKIETLLPLVLSFVSDMMNPLLDKIDTVHYTQQSRVLKVAEDYAVRLLEPKYSRSQAEGIARRLVNAYSEHEFVIDRDEAQEFLDLAELTETKRQAIDRLESYLTANPLTVIGRLAEKREGDGA